MRCRTHIVLLGLCLGAACFLPARDDDPTSPPFTFDPELAELWPHADGTAWTYALASASLETPDFTVYSTPEEIPPLPSYAELYAALQAPPDFEPDTFGSGTLSLEFDGTVEIGPGFETQRLSETLTPEAGDPVVPYPLQGVLWRLESERIAGYSEYLGLYPAWVYLGPDLQPGGEFSLQLLPGLADDIVLHGRIMRHLRLPWGDDEIDCVECLYLLDMGVPTMVDEGGETPGHVHPFIFGVVVYGRDVGPISCRERRVVYHDGILQDGAGSVHTDIQAELTPSE